MNFFDGAIKAANGKITFEEGKLAQSRPSGGNGKASDEPVVMTGDLTFPGNGFTLSLDSLPSPVKNRLAARAGAHVVLGIRPEHIHLRPVDEVGAALQVKLNVIEPLGSDMDVYMSTALHDYVVGRLEAQDGLRAGTDTTVYVDVRKAHLFEPGATGMNLSLETVSPTSEIAHALA
jgi:hypothetical protein